MAEAEPEQFSFELLPMNAGPPGTREMLAMDQGVTPSMLSVAHARFTEEGSVEILLAVDRRGDHTDDDTTTD